MWCVQVMQLRQQLNAAQEAVARADTHRHNMVPRDVHSSTVQKAQAAAAEEARQQAQAQHAAEVSSPEQLSLTGYSTVRELLFTKE